MKCLLLAGGHGTRLRPLTLSVPKPFIPFCNRPIIEYQIEASVKAGVDHIILGISAEQRNMVPMIEEVSQRYKVRIDCSIETEALGTAGPLRFAKNLLCDPQDDSEEFIVVNSDIICNYPFAEMIAAHRKNHADGTILVTKTMHPSEFGVIVHDDEYRIKAFVEKPMNFISNQINAGVYIIKKTVLDHIPEGNVSIERYFFPLLVSMGKTFCHPLYGRWADVGKPADYIRAQKLYMCGDSYKEHETLVCSDSGSIETLEKSDIVILKTKGGLLVKNREAMKSCGETVNEEDVSDLTQYPNIGADVVIRPPVIIHTSAVIAQGCVIGPNVSIGPNTVIGNGCRIIRSAILQGARLEGHTYIEGSIIGWDSHIRPWVRVEGLSVLGKNVTVDESLFLRGCIVLPHKTITKSIYEDGSIII